MKTTGLFTTHRVEIEVELGKPFKLIPFGDIHRDSDMHAHEHWEEFLAYAKKQKNAVFLGMGDYCMPLSAEILTQEGWKTYDKLVNGELVLGFDAQTNTTRWVPLSGVVLNPDSKVIRLKSKSFEMACTPKHAWYVQQAPSSGDTRIQRLQTDALKTHHRIIVAAPLSEGGDDGFMTADEAWMLGWIVTDGHSRKSNRFDCNIGQSEKKYASEIRNRLKAWFTGEYKTVTPGCVTFNISNPKVRVFFNRIGYTGKHDLPKIVTKLGRDARAAMLDAMLKAEGWKERGHWRFSQLRGPVLDAFQMLVTLEGKRLGIETQASNKVVSQRIVAAGRQHVGVADLSFSAPESEPTWCPQTPLRSWVVRYRGCISITGNTDGVSTSERIILSDSGMHDTTKRTLDGVYKGVTKTLYNELSFMKGRCLGLIGGNHYFAFENGDTTDHVLAAALGTKFLGVCSFIRLSLRFKNRPGVKQSLDIFAHHGKGGGSLPGSTFNSIEKMLNTADADFYFMGHDHKKGAIPSTPRLKLTCTGKNAELRVQERTPWLGRTGSFLKAYEPGRVSYNVDAARSPCSLGWIEFEIVPYRDCSNGDDLIRFKIRGTS